MRAVAAYAAAAWAFLFAVPSFYRAAGGRVGAGTIAATSRLSASPIPWCSR
jgi:hypothetical protein